MLDEERGKYRDVIIHNVLEAFASTQCGKNLLHKQIRTKLAHTLSKSDTGMTAEDVQVYTWVEWKKIKNLVADLETLEYAHNPSAYNLSWNN